MEKEKESGQRSRENEKERGREGEGNRIFLSPLPQFHPENLEMKYSLPVT